MLFPLVSKILVYSLQNWYCVMMESTSTYAILSLAGAFCVVVAFSSILGLLLSHDVMLSVAAAAIATERIMFFFIFLSVSNFYFFDLALRISQSWSTTQCMPRSCIALLSWIWYDLKRPFFSKMTLADNNATAIAIINMVKSNVSVIFF